MQLQREHDSCITLQKKPHPRETEQRPCHHPRSELQIRHFLVAELYYQILKEEHAEQLLSHTASSKT